MDVTVVVTTVETAGGVIVFVRVYVTLTVAVRGIVKAYVVVG